MSKIKKYKKKTILNLIKGKTISKIIANLQELEAQGYGDCKVELKSNIASGNVGVYSCYIGKIKCNILIPEEM